MKIIFGKKSEARKQSQAEKQNSDGGASLASIASSTDNYSFDKKAQSLDFYVNVIDGSLRLKITNLIQN